MDGFLQSEGVVVIAATNFPESLDQCVPFLYGRSRILILILCVSAERSSDLVALTESSRSLSQTFEAVFKSFSIICGMLSRP